MGIFASDCVRRSTAHFVSAAPPPPVYGPKARVYACVVLAIVRENPAAIESSTPMRICCALPPPTTPFIVAPAVLGSALSSHTVLPRAVLYRVHQLRPRSHSNYMYMELPTHSNTQTHAHKERKRKENAAPSPPHRGAARCTYGRPLESRRRTDARITCAPS